MRMISLGLLPNHLGTPAFPQPMMLVVQSWSFPSSLVISQRQKSEGQYVSIHLRKQKRASSFSNKSMCEYTNVGIDDLADIIHNRVLIAAALSGAIGQLLKPFTSTIFYRKNFDFKTAFQAGGLPSTHSSAVVATATSLGLERGFSDAIFGLAVVYAVLIMYDAQGVRREVGTHAKTLNRVLLKTQINSISSSEVANDLSDSFPRKSSTNLQTSDRIFLNGADDFQRKEKKDSLLLDSNPELISTSIASDVKGGPKSVSFSYSPLKESVGHTEIEVIAGALLGFFISLSVCIM